MAVACCALITVLSAGSAAAYGPKERTGPQGAFRETPQAQGSIVDTPEIRNDIHAMATPEDPSLLAMSVTIHTVVIRVAGDEEWRAYYGSTAWDDRANDAIEAADNSLYSSFGIDLAAVQFVQWDSAPDSGTCGQVIDDLELVGRGGNDVLMGFTKQQFNAGGCSELDYVLVKYQGPSNDWKVTQHEVSHLYGADDASGLHPNDVMEDPYNYPNKWCTYLSGPGWDHWGTMQLNAGEYD